MAKKVPVASKHRLMIFGTLSIVLMGYFFVTLVTYTININQLRKKENEVNAELLSLKEDAEDLQATILKLKDPDYVARYAREKYDYSANGEYIIKIKEKKEKIEEEEKASYPYYIYGSAFCFVCVFLYMIKRK